MVPFCKKQKLIDLEAAASGRWRTQGWTRVLAVSYGTRVENAGRYKADKALFI